jgi:hypothetical protein
VICVSNLGDNVESADAYFEFVELTHFLYAESATFTQPPRRYLLSVTTSVLSPPRSMSTSYDLRQKNLLKFYAGDQQWIVHRGAQ